MVVSTLCYVMPTQNKTNVQKGDAFLFVDEAYITKELGILPLVTKSCKNKFK